MPRTTDAWRNYRQRRRRLVLVALAGVALFGLSFLPAAAWHSGKPVLGALALFIGTTLWAAASLSSFPCPHCGKPFSYNDDTREAFTRKCVHCQRPKWSNPD